MARRNEEGGGTATMEPGEQADLFPELVDKPEHKTLMRLAKQFHKKKVARDEMKSTAKQEEDAAMEKLIAAMHDAGLEKFRFGGVTVNVVPAKEKVVVKIATEDDDESDDDSE